MRSLFANDRNWIVAGIVAAALIPLLSLYAGFPVLVAIAIAAIVFAALVLLLAPRKLFEGIDIRAIGSGRVAFARDLLAEAEPYHQRLLAAAGRIGDGEAARRVGHLATVAADVFAGIEASPEKASGVKRFLNYYIPRAAEVAEGFVMIEAKRQPDKARLDQMRDVLVKLDEAFIHYADSLVDDELAGLDTDLRLIQAALKEDIRS